VRHPIGLDDRDSIPGTAAPTMGFGSVLRRTTCDRTKVRILCVLSGQAVLKGILSGELDLPSVMLVFCNN
jgi:hypothetical protein